MRFETRSKQQTVLADLISKLEALPTSHPDRPALTRMIHDLSDEIRLAPGQPGTSPLPRSHTTHTGSVRRPLEGV
jgi:hypothetical protein